jgi:hypothetical protein
LVFDSHKQLLDELLLDWEQRNTEGFKSVLRESGRNGMAEFQALVDIWLNEKAYSPAWDAAVRDWARVSSKVARADGPKMTGRVSRRPDTTPVHAANNALASLLRLEPGG